jgi:hypothetical protein
MERPKQVIKRLALSAPVKRLMIAQGLLELGDGITTRKQKENGNNEELGPLCRLILGRHPNGSRMAPLGTVELIGSAWLSEKMRRSQRFYRIWWLPQVALIAGHSYGLGRNIERLQSGRRMGQ